MIVYLRPTGVRGGDGTESSPYTSFLTLRDKHSFSPGDEIRIERGYVERVDSGIGDGVWAENLVWLRQGQDGVKVRPHGDPTKPLSKLEMYHELTTASDWVEISPEGVDENGMPRGLLPGSNLWYYNGTAGQGTLTKMIGFLGFGDLRSSERRSPKEVNRRTPHMVRDWNDANGNVAQPEWIPEAQWQWDAERAANKQGWIVVYSEGNPIEAAGGVIYIGGQYDCAFRAESVDGFDFERACRFQYVPVPINVLNEVERSVHTCRIVGLYADHPCMPFTIRSGPPGATEGPNIGSVWQPIHPYSELQSRDDIACLEGVIDDVQIDHAHGSAAFMRWGVRNFRVSNFRSWDGALGGGWCAMSFGNINPPEDKPIVVSGFDVRRMLPYVAKGMYYDPSAFDCDGNVGGVEFEDGYIEQCMRGIQFSGGRPGQKARRVEIRDCLIGVDMKTGTQDGESQITVVDVDIDLNMEPWALQEDEQWKDLGNLGYQHPLGIVMDAKLSLPGAGPSDDSRDAYASPYVRGARIKIHAPEGSVAVMNKCLTAVVTDGPWHDGDGDGVSDRNGFPVTPGQQQQTSFFEPFLWNVTVTGGGKLYTDKDGNEWEQSPPWERSIWDIIQWFR